MIELIKIKQSYTQGNTNVNVLNGVDLNIKRGEKIGLIGPSGSGKTSLLNIIGLLDTPDSGEMFIDKEDCLSLSTEEKTKFRKNKIGYIFQNNQLLEDFTVQENIALPLILNGNSKDYSLDIAKKYLEILGLDNREKFKPGTLSGGEQQRVAIARALIKKPVIIVADEPTGSLDEENTEKVMKIIMNLTKELNIALLIATHNVGIVKMLDKYFLINEGKLDEQK